MKNFVLLFFIFLSSKVLTLPVENVNEIRKLNPEEVANQYEGDIVLSENKATRGGRNALTNTFYQWPKVNGQVTIPYTIKGTYSTSDLSLIRSSLDEIQQNSCIKFVQRSTQNDYIEVVSKSGCSSKVGRAGGKQEVTLAASTATTHCMVKGIIIHEILHAMGFYHMHSSAERDNFVKINLQNVIWGLSYAFSKESSSSLLGTPYDLESVMHYSPYYFSNNGKPTIEPLNKSYLSNNLMGQRVGLSSGDIKRINKLYKC